MRIRGQYCAFNRLIFHPQFATPLFVGAQRGARHHRIAKCVVGEIQSGAHPYLAGDIPGRLDAHDVGHVIAARVIFVVDQVVHKGDAHRAFIGGCPIDARASDRAAEVTHRERSVLAVRIADPALHGGVSGKPVIDDELGLPLHVLRVQQVDGIERTVKGADRVARQHRHLIAGRRDILHAGLDAVFREAAHLGERARVVEREALEAADHVPVGIHVIVDVEMLFVRDLQVPHVVLLEVRVVA